MLLLLPSIFGLFTLLESTPLFNEANGTVIVHTSLGSLRGLRIESYDNRSGFAFYAVPFAESTDGPRRFALPEPRKPWSGIKDATVKGMACPADPMMMWMGQNNWTRMDEDCLHNYIFTSKRCLMKGGCAVFFEIHGGIFDFLTPVRYQADAIIHNFASDGQDVVVVVSAFRLNVFGFLNLAPGRRDLSTDSNVQIHDIRESLKWVQREIAAFGGDPRRVTLGGISSGAMMAELISVSPSFNGLYSQLACRSGTYSSTTAPIETNLLTSWLTAELLGCADVNTNRLETESIEMVVECMRNKTWQEIVHARIALNDHPEPLFRPQTDGEGGLFPEFFPEMAKKRRAVPTLIGATAVESLMAKYALDENRKVIMSRLEEMCMAVGYGNNYSRPETAGRLCMEYYAQDEKVKTFHGDLVFYVPIFQTAKQITEKGAPVYVYSFGFRGVPLSNVNYKPEEHPTHGEDLSYIFNIVRNFSARDYAVEKIYSGIFLHFIKTGYPYPGEGQRPWNKFTTSKHDYYRIDFPDSSNLMPGNRKFYQREPVKLWLKTIAKKAGVVRPLNEFPKYFNHYLVEEVTKVFEEHHTQVATRYSKTVRANEEAYDAWTEYINGRRFKHLNGTITFGHFVSEINEVPLKT